MSFSPGNSWGYDEVSPYDEIPFSFDLASTENGRTILAAKDEYPQIQAVEYPGPLPTLTDRGIVRALVNPSLPPSGDDTTVQERFRGGRKKSARERFRDLRDLGDFDIFSADNVQIVLLLLLIMVIVIQIKIFTTMETMIKLRMMTPGQYPLGAQPSEL
jgi:hypothetical protein